jgi:hypothetical protein
MGPVAGLVAVDRVAGGKLGWQGRWRAPGGTILLNRGMPGWLPCGSVTGFKHPGRYCSFGPGPIHLFKLS